MNNEQIKGVKKLITRYNIVYKSKPSEFRKAALRIISRELIKNIRNIQTVNGKIEGTINPKIIQIREYSGKIKEKRLEELQRALDPKRSTITGQKTWKREKIAKYKKSLAERYRIDTSKLTNKQIEEIWEDMNDVDDEGYSYQSAERQYLMNLGYSSFLIDIEKKLKNQHRGRKQLLDLQAEMVKYAGEEFDPNEESREAEYNEE